MHTVSRRGLLVLGGTGAAGAVLASCGGKTNERDETDDGALLSAALAAETALGQAYGAGTGATFAAFASASHGRADELRRLLADAGGGQAGADGSASQDTGALANAAIAAYRAGAGPLSTEQLRGTMIAFLAAVAAELAALSELGGKDPVPYAFVTGGDEEPNVATDSTADGDATTTTTTGEGE